MEFALNPSSWSADLKEEIEPKTFTLNTSSWLFRRLIQISRFNQNQSHKIILKSLPTLFLDEPIFLIKKQGKKILLNTDSLDYTNKVTS